MKSADNKQNPPVERAGVSFSEKNIEKKLASNNKEAGGTFTFEDGSVHCCWKYNIWLQHAWWWEEERAQRGALDVKRGKEKLREITFLVRLTATYLLHFLCCHNFFFLCLKWNIMFKCLLYFSAFPSSSSPSSIPFFSLPCALIKTFHSPHNL